MLQNKTNRTIVYITTLLAFSSTVGLIGVYAMVKQPMARELGLDQQFLGLCDSMNFLGNTFGFMFYMLKPMIRPKRDFFASSMFTSFVLILIPISAEYINYSKGLVLSSNFLSGFTRVYMMAPYLIVIHHFDAAVKDRRIMNIWGTLTALGDVFSVLGMGAMLKFLAWDWKISFIYSIGVYTLITIIHHLSVDQVNLQEHNKEKGVKTDITWKQFKQLITEFYTKDRNYLWALDFFLMEAIYYCILVWFPYYFIQIGYEESYIEISIMFPLFFCIGSVLHEYCLSFCPSKEIPALSLQLIFNCILYFLMIFSQFQAPLLFIVMTGLNGLFTGGPFGYIISSEMFILTERANNFYYPYTVTKILEKFFIFLVLVLCGVLMKTNIRSFLHVILAMTILNFVVFTSRQLLCKKKSEQAHQIRTNEKLSQRNMVE